MGSQGDMTRIQLFSPLKVVGIQFARTFFPEKKNEHGRACGKRNSQLGVGIYDIFLALPNIFLTNDRNRIFGFPEIEFARRKEFSSSKIDDVNFLVKISI